MALLVLVLALFVADNKEFLDTVDEQRAKGYSWHEIDCRPVNSELPALTIDTHTGKSLVCYKLQK